MKSYIPHRILIINDHLVEARNKEVIELCYQLAFDWANRMGMEGKRVYDLFLQRPDPNDLDPSKPNSYLYCKIECTLEEREKWEKSQELI